MIHDVPQIEVELQMLRPILNGYRPHLRVGEGEYLGISFTDIVQVSTGDTVRAKASLMYWPNVDYSSLRAGVQFQVMEGAQAVGRGTVVMDWDAIV
jgi:hypothetical protein